MAVVTTSRQELLAKKFIGAALEVHKVLGPGYEESVYANALAEELSRGQIAFEREKAVDVYYKGVRVGEKRLDFMLEQELVVELKAVEDMNDKHMAQNK